MTVVIVLAVTEVNKGMTVTRPMVNTVVDTVVMAMAMLRVALAM